MINLFKKQLSYELIVGICFLFFWIMAVTLTFFDLLDNYLVGEYGSALGLIIQILIIYNTKKICDASSSVYDKKTFFCFFLASIALFVTEAAFYVLVFLRGIPVKGMPFSYFLLHYIPSLVAWGFLTIYLFRMLSPYIVKIKPLIKIFFAFIIFSIIVIKISFLSINVCPTIAPDTVAPLKFTIIYKLVIFGLTMLCLMYVEDIGFMFLLTGIVVLTAATFLFNYLTFTQNQEMVAYGELFWDLGIFLMLLGVLFIRKKRSYGIRKCFRVARSIKSKLILWTFSISVISFVLFFVAAYYFSFIGKEFLSILPFFIMIYSVIVVALSVFMGQYFETPFKRLTENIKFFISHKTKKVENFSIEEFSCLQKFLLEMFEINEEKDRMKKHLGEVSAQVAHDIRSPLMVLKAVLNDLSSLPERKRIDARNAIQRVTDIANNLLAQYRQDSQELVNSSIEYRSEPVAIMVESIVSEKRIQIASSSIDIILQFSSNIYDAFVYIDLVEFKRALSNLMNNAIEALKEVSGVITIQLSRNKEGVVIDIRDNGCGISEEKLSSLLKEGGSFDKKEGYGLGLPYAMNKIKAWHGTYSLTSRLGEGTQFEIILPEAKPAEWFMGHITLVSGNVIIVLDDDEYIHQIWDERLPKEFLLENRLKLLHFTNPNELILFCKDNVIKDTVFFIDYELNHEQMTGLDVARELGIGNCATLVTSRYEDDIIREKCQKFGMKIIPKFFAKYVPINIRKSTDIVLIDNEELITYYWKESAEGCGKTISVFNDPNDFIKVAHHYSTGTMIYIDSALNNELKGEDFAKVLHERGYCNVILATGYPKDHFKHVTWVKDVVGKEPPWGDPPRKRRHHQNKIIR